MPKNLFTFNFKKLPLACILSIILIIMIYSLELFVLPINFFTFRAWEALKVQKIYPTSGPFYPNIEIVMQEEGDLAHHTKLAIKKDVIWQTDIYGQRKKNNNINKYDIVIVGESNIGGSTLTQKDTIAQVLERNLGLKVYPFVDNDVPPINGFFNNNRFMINPPKIVILGVIERHISLLPEIKALSNQKNIILWEEKPKLAVLADRVYKNNMARYLLARVKKTKEKIINIIRNFFIKDYATNSPYADGNKMLFLQGPTANIAVSEGTIKKIITILNSYNQICKARKIRFIFLPIPNKENIYYDQLPIKNKPDFLKRLIKQLKEASIEVIDTQTAFDQTRNSHDVILFNIDDSHWNANAVNLTADLIKKTLSHK